MDLLFPGDPGFYEVLHGQLPPAATVSEYYVVREDTGLLEAASRDEVDDYLYGGEYEEVVDADHLD